MRQNQGDRLRMLVLDKVQQLFRVGLAGELERSDLKRRGEAVDEGHRLLFPDRLLEHRFRESDAALRDIALCHGELVELAHNRFFLFG